MDTTSGVRRVDTQKGHYYTINGQRAVGVTTALNALPKDLTRWAAKTVAEHVVDQLDDLSASMLLHGRETTIDYLTGLPHQVRDSAGERGTSVHDLVYQLAHGDAVEVPHEIAAYVRGAVQYLDDWQPTTVLAEAVVASYQHFYCGTLDSIQDVPGLGRVLVDWKTSRGVYGNHALQLAAYRYADIYLDDDGIEQSMVDVEDTYILHIKPDDYDLIPVTAGREQHTVFLTVLDVYRKAVQSDKLKKLIGAPLAKPVAVTA